MPCAWVRGIGRGAPAPRRPRRHRTHVMDVLPNQVGWYAAWFPNRGARVVFCYPEGQHVVAEVRDGQAPVLRPLTDASFHGTTWKGPFDSRLRAHDAIDHDDGRGLLGTPPPGGRNA